MHPLRPSPYPASVSNSPQYPAALTIAGLALELREIEPQRIKFVVQEAAPAAGALAAGARWSDRGSGRAPRTCLA